MTVPGRKTSLVAKIGLATASGVLAYAVCDLAAGMLLIRPLSPATVPDQILHHVTRPDTFSRIRTSEFDYVQRSNNVGLRGRDIEPAKPPGVYRIIMLGDSFTQGKGVADEETFSARLESRLNREAPSGVTFEVLNAGTDSYTPILSFLQLAHRLVHLEPDLVVLNFDMSDLLQEQAYRSVATFGPSGEVLAVTAQPVGADIGAQDQVHDLRRWIDNNLYLTRRLAAFLDQPGDRDGLTVDNVVRRRNRRLLLHTLGWDREDRSQQWRDVLASIKSIASYCDERGLDFLVTTYPWGHQVDAREWASGRNWVNPKGSPISDRSIDRLEAFTTAEGIDFLNLFPAFRSYRGDELLYYEKDMHWTAAGHALMAREFERFLRERQPWARSAD